MMIKFSYGQLAELVEYKDAKEAHDHLVPTHNCSCHCETCSEDDPMECLESELEQNYPGATIVEEV